MINTQALGRFQMFPISRDPPKGGTGKERSTSPRVGWRFQFLGIPPKGELGNLTQNEVMWLIKFPISRDPPKGGTLPLLNPSGARNARPICEGVGRRGQKKAWQRGGERPESVVAQGIERVNEKIGFCGFWRGARRSVDTVFMCFWQHET